MKKRPSPSKIDIVTTKTPAPISSHLIKLKLSRQSVLGSNRIIYIVAHTHRRPLFIRSKLQRPIKWPQSRHFDLASSWRVSKYIFCLYLLIICVILLHVRSTMTWTGEGLFGQPGWLGLAIFNLFRGLFLRQLIMGCYWKFLTCGLFIWKRNIFDMLPAVIGRNSSDRGL